jgi:hypothetical protein
MVERTLAAAAGAGLSAELALVQGQTFLLTGKLDEARAAFERARSHAPDADVARFELARMAWRRGDNAETSKKGVKRGFLSSSSIKDTH